MNDKLYSLRMRASKGGQHVSGAERIVNPDQVPVVTTELVTRAMQSASGAPDDIQCRVEALDPQTVEVLKLPDVSTWQVNSWQAGRSLAVTLLVKAGMPGVVAEQGVQLLNQGPAPKGAVMRGALILDIRTGERLEPDAARGVRVSRMDLVPEAAEGIRQQLAAAGLTHHRVLEALVLSGKVLSAPGIVAELCWSDDPGYQTGYVSTPAAGYQRITLLKPPGDTKGGRVFFVDTNEWDAAAFVSFLEQQPVLFNALGDIQAVQTGGA